MIDVEDVLQRVEAGESQAEIARSLGTYPMAISRLLDQSDEIKLRSARARERSAEAWLDRGLETLEKALDKESGMDASAARADEQACARRAALRNPAYREKQALEHSGPNGGPVAFQAVERLIVDSKAT